ncbi:MAG TPA: hypothetical protein VIK61_16065 [Acidimicrobiia bacterium]
MASRAHLERLGLRFYLDTNFVGDGSPAAVELRALHDAGWIGLHRTDTVDTELAGDPDVARRTGLLAMSADYVESFGPLILDHSRLDHAVIGNDDDGARLNAVYAVLFPGSNRSDPSTGRASNKLRDAMHVATAIRYGAAEQSVALLDALSEMVVVMIECELLDGDDIEMVCAWLDLDAPMVEDVRAFLDSRLPPDAL